VNAPTSLTAYVAAVSAGEHVVAAGFPGGVPTLALTSGLVRRLVEGGPQDIEAHPDAGLVSAVIDHAATVTGGDDGRIVRVAKDGTPELLGEVKGRWIDAVTSAPGGAVAWSAGKKVSARDEKGRVRDIEVPSTPQGLVFSPKGYRLAIAHYSGVSLWFPNVEAPPEVLDWKGSHLEVVWSPDGKFVVTSMQENMLHGWRLADRKDMRMSGYPSKPRCLHWSHDGQWLATSGADAAIIWPFQDKDGPMGKAPRECGVRNAKVSRVAFHPGALVLAVGYEDNCILLARLQDGAELLVRAAVKGAGAVTALAWDKQGKRLIFGTAEGEAGILTLP
jgi:WD40 repeat protein